MALRRRDVILASVAAFVSWGFVTSWIPSLQYLPYAFLAGVAASVITLAWILLSTSRSLQDEADEANTRRPRTAAFAVPEVWSAEKRALSIRTAYNKEPIYPQSALISEGIESLLSLVSRDFVGSWYGHISKNPTFPNEVDGAIRAALASIRDRLLALDVVEVVVSRLVPVLTAHMRDSYDAERAVRGKGLTKSVTESEELDLAVARKYRDGKLHPAASLAYSDTKTVQQQHLRNVMVKLLPWILPAKMTSSPAVCVLIKEIVACSVLFPLMQLLADPDTWNQLMDAYGRTLLQERKTVRKLRAALDEHTPVSIRSQKPVTLPKLGPGDSERQFERFIRAIRLCNSLSDARRLRSEVASQLKRESVVEGQDVKYLRRLETGKRMLDQKIAFLGAGRSTKSTPAFTETPGPRKSALENASLKEVLYNAAGLSYLMEYMDRLGLMRLVQFYLVVDGFRNPLIEDNNETDDISMASSWTEAERTDVSQLYEAYMTKPELKIPDDLLRAVRAFLKAGKNATASDFSSAQRAILKAQSWIFNEMEERYFPRFRNSDLFYKWLASDEASSNQSKPKDADVPTFYENTGTPGRHGKLGRLSSHISAKAPDLRRAVVSSSDLRNGLKPTDAPAAPRRSLDDSARRAPLFEDDYESDPLAHSTQSLDSDIEPSRGNENDPGVVDAMQAAFNDIMGQEPDKDSLFSESSMKSPADSDFMRASFEVVRPAPLNAAKGKTKPSLSSLGLVGGPTRGTVFSDDLFAEEEKFIEDEREDSDVNEKTEDEEIHEAAPGDLGLTEAIDELSAEIEKLVVQESIVDSLTRKAELTNNAAELRILRKSKASLEREMRRKELQRQQYIVQESDNSLYGRATVSIQSVMVGNDDDGREYALCESDTSSVDASKALTNQDVIEVRRQAGEQMPAAAWVVARRYSEFHELNKRLRARYHMVRNLDFPRRQVVFKLQKEVIQKRRQSLENYLRSLLLIPAVCRSRELRAFLSERTITSNAANGASASANSRDFVTRIYNSVTDGMEEFLGNISVLDQLSLAGQNLISAATSQLNALPPGAPSSIAQDSSAVSTAEAEAAAEAEAELRAFEAKELEPFVTPICDAFLEVFELNRANNWLRGRAVVVVLHQLLGGTVERKVRESAKALLSEESVSRYFVLLRETMWPDGKLRLPVVRTTAEKAKSRKEAGVLLASLIPELMGSVVGRTNAQAASRRILATLNNQRLNIHLVFTLLDEILAILFPQTGLAGGHEMGK